MAVQALLEAPVRPPFLRPAELESRRFGLHIGRADLGSIPGGTAALIDEIRASDFDLVVLRYPAAETTLFAQLLGTGYAVIHADTLLYAEKTLSGPDPVELARFDHRVASVADRSTISDLVGEVFDQYGSHYSANPVLDPDVVRAGYVEWAHSFIGSRDRAFLVLSDPGEDELRAFSTVDTTSPGEIVLVGVTPGARGHGWHGRASAVAEAQLRHAGCHTAWSSTQIHNIAVQRSWRTRGYVPRLSLQTVHLVRRDRWEPGRSPT